MLYNFIVYARFHSFCTMRTIRINNLVKRVLVTMSDECAAVLKQYAAAWGITQSEALYESMRHHIHCHAKCCKSTKQILENQLIALDKRVDKPCYGFGCRGCVHQTACRIGLYDGTWEMAERYKHLLSGKVHA